LLDKPKMETRCIGDCLDVVGGGEVVVASGNRRKFPFQQARNCWWERVPEIGVLGAAALPCPSAGVDCELHEIGEPSDVLSIGRFAARQRAKLIQIDGIRALCNQVRVDEREDDFDGSQEPQNCHVSFCETAACFLGEGRYAIGQQSSTEGSCSSYRKSLAQQGTAGSSIFRLLRVMLHDLLFLRQSQLILHDLLLIMIESVERHTGSGPLCSMNNGYM
jgi:hypothetical protein